MSTEDHVQPTPAPTPFQEALERMEARNEKIQRLERELTSAQAALAEKDREIAAFKANNRYMRGHTAGYEEARSEFEPKLRTEEVLHKAASAERDALRAEVEQLKACVKRYEQRLDEARRERDAAEAQLAAALADKERLDWLASQCYYPYDHPQDGVFVVVSENSAPHGAFTLERDGDRKALRAAIDRAMEAQP